jgi:hypothetical protein
VNPTPQQLDRRSLAFDSMEDAGRTGEASTLTAVTQRRNSSGAPRDAVGDGGSWPDDPMPGGAPAGDGSAAACVAAAKIAERLQIALEGRTVAGVAREADVARSTIYDILAGNTWPDIVTLFKLEKSLKVRLWGLR